jgi:hypothetical protein
MAWSCATNSLRRALSCSVQGALIKRTILSVLHRRFKAARRPAALADSNGSMGVGRVMMLLRIRRESALIFFKTAVGAVDKKTDLPDRLFGERPVQSQLQKYSCSRVTQINSISPAVPSRERGVSRSSRTRRGMRWTRAALLTRALTCGRRSRVVLTPRRWRQVGGRQFR